MYKVKVAVLYENGEQDARWNYGFVDWDGNGSKELDEILSEYGKSEEKMLRGNVDRTIHVKKVLIIETFDITDGKNQCGSCECYFDKDDDGDCPFCGSGNWVVGCIDEPEPNKKCENHCPKCDATDPDIEWGDKEWFDDGAYQAATCGKCGCDFKEYYQYTDTEIVE